tara:strand:- start:191 stop:529 length:339 start_codon:yes stop_codon:yes gene_type:complete
MNLASQIAPKITARSVFSIDSSPDFEPAGLASGVQNQLVPTIEPIGSGPVSLNEFTSGLGIAGTPRCFVNGVLGLNRILRPEPIPDEYGMRPQSALSGMPPSAPAMPPAFVR